MRKNNWKKIVAMLLMFGFLATPLAFAKDASIKGTVQQSDQGVVIAADDGNTYLIMGEDISSMVGKTVKATGNLIESDAGKQFTVYEVEEME